jgi:hypothetical protein
MAAGDTWPARRVPVPGSGDINEVLFDLEPGDYCGPVDGYTGGKPAVFFLLPAGAPREVRGIRHVVSPPHVFTEQPDGSLEIRESLGCDRRPEGGYVWHGYLDVGNGWREV